MDAIIARLKSKTYWAALIGAALSAVELQSGFFSHFLPEGYRPYLVMAWPPLMLALRELTSTALADK